MTDSGGAVFLSYASQDAEAAQRLCNALHAAGIEVWFDQSELRGGDAWDQEIRREIRDCALFIPLISANTAARPEGYFRLEWSLAEVRSHMIARNKAFIVPVCLDQTPESGADVPESFQRVQWTRLPEGTISPAFTARIAALLSASVASSGATIVPVAPPAVVHTSVASHTPHVYLAAIALAILAIAGLPYFVFDRFPLSKRTPTDRYESAVVPAPAVPAIPEKSVAVLPFVDMSEKHDQEYFSDGLSEELIDHLARTSDLKVIARTSSFQFKGKSDDIRNIGHLLGVANLLEGSVRTSGKSIRITAQLIKVSDGSLRWSESYDRNLGDIFKLQDEIAGAVERALNSAMSGRVLREISQSTANIEAYDALLQGRYWYDRDDSDNAIASYLTATKLDPQYALAWGELARAYTGRAFARGLDSQADVESIRQALARAFAIDPKLSVAHSALGLVHHFYDWNWSEAEAEFTQAHELDPNNVTALRGMGRVAETLGQYDEAMDRYNQALTIDPLSARTLLFLAATLADKGLLGQSEVILKKILKLYPAGPFRVHLSLFRVLLARGEPKAALEALQAEPEEIARNAALPIAYWALGRRAESDSALHTLEANHANDLPFSIAADHAYRGEPDDAFLWLTKAYQQRDSSLVSVKTTPHLRALYGDARYKTLLRKMNLPE